MAADSLTVYRGQVIGFCNPGCRDKFDKAVTCFEEALREADIHPPMKAGFIRLAGYNRWINENLYQAVAQLSDTDYKRDLGAFFKSVHGTLNHILVWDITWLQRFSAHHVPYRSLDPVKALPTPVSHEQILHHRLTDLHQARQQADAWIEALVLETEEEHYPQRFSYTVSTGQQFHKPFGGMLQHVFNHQTHHRGQITALLFQLGIDPGVTDLLATLPDMPGPEAEQATQ